MKVYTVLYDVDENFLVAQRRVMNRWWGGKVAPTHSILFESNQYCMPSGERKINESILASARRIFLEQTGHAIPEKAHCTPFPRDDYVLMLFWVPNLAILQNQINRGLAKSPSNYAAPLNKAIKDWELAKVIHVKQSSLHEYLGRERKWNDTEPGFYYPNNDDAAADSVRRHRDIVNFLKSI